MRDTIDKIVQTYFACLTNIEFAYKEKGYVPKRLIISPLIFRGYDCPELCGVCCHPISLDYLPNERHLLNDNMRMIEISGKKYPIYTTYQNDKNKKCHYLNYFDGRCQIHGIKPMPCCFELLKFTNFKTKSYFGTKLYGRGWALTRCDGQKKAMCKITSYSEERHEDIIKQIKRLKDWCDYFELSSKILKVLDYVESGPHKRPFSNWPGWRRITSIIWINNIYR